MATTASRPMPRNPRPVTTRAPARPAVRSRPAGSAHATGGAATGPAGNGDHRRTRLLQGGAVGGVLALVILAVYLFAGTPDWVSAALRFGAEPPPAAAPGPGSTTTVYRDLGDGRVLVMEIDGRSTRIVGTVDRVDAPRMNRDAAGGSAHGGEVNSRARLDAFSKTFKAFQ